MKKHLSKNFRWVLLAAVLFAAAWIKLKPIALVPVAVGSVTPDPTATVVPTVRSTPSPTPTSTSASTPTSTPTVTATIQGQPYEIGLSVEGRPLEMVQFGSGAHHLLIIAGVHGGYEWNTVNLADELIIRLQSGDVAVPDDVTLFILRNLNPDGTAKQLGPDCRANADGVDLNRNWDANWQENWYGSECWSQRYLTAGTAPFSEPETKALSNFILENNIEALMNYHSAGLGIFPGGWWQDQASLNLASQLALVSPYQYPPYDSDCEYTGQLIDWASTQGIAAVDVELSNHTDTDLEINLRILKVFLNYQTYLDSK